MQLLRQPDAQPYEIVRLPENPLRHLTHCLSFLCVLTKILCVKYAVTPLNGKAAKMHQNRFRLGLSPRPRWAAYSAAQAL